MKNTYTKPILVMESFVMSQSIAHNCGDSLDFSQATLKYKSTCGWDSGVGIVFTETNTVCKLVDGEAVCYNNPDGGINIFNS